jgi:hypothetical protein
MGRSGVRRVAVAVAAALWIGLVSGPPPENDAIEVVEPVVNKPSIDNAVAGLGRDLRAMSTGFSVKTSALDGGASENRFWVRIDVFAISISVKQTLAIVQRVTETCNSAEFAEQDCLLDIYAADGYRVTIDVFDLTDEVVRSELNYAIAFARVAGGDVVLDLDAARSFGEIGPSYRRFVGVAEAINVDWRALRSMADTSRASKSWRVAGLNADGPFPPEEVTGLYDKVTSIIPTPDYNALQDDYLSFVWDGDAGSVSESIQSTGFVNGLEASQSPAWSKVLAILGATATAGHPARFEYFGVPYVSSDGEDVDPPAGSIYLGTCNVEQWSFPGDESLFSEVVSAGVALPSGSTPGSCELPQISDED